MVKTTLTKVTKKFIKYIHKNKSRTINLNLLAEKMNVPKRRVYDITNVLEGINFIKKSKIRNEMDVLPIFIQTITKIEETNRLNNLMKEYEKVTSMLKEYKSGEILSVEEIDDNDRYFIKKKKL